MENLYSVRIIRREDQAVEGEYIKQFWMFCGVYVREFILEYAEDMEDIQEVDCNIFLTEGDAQADLKNLKAEKEIFIHLQDRCDLSSVAKRKEFGDMLKPLLLERIAENRDDDIYKVYDVFVNNDMAYVNLLCHLYLYQFDSENDREADTNGSRKKSQKEKYIGTYKKCLNDFYKSGEGFTGSIYKKFAYLNCGRKLNRICRANKELAYFNVEAIVREAYHLSREDKRFSMGNVLAGLTGLSEDGTERTAEDCLYSALQKERGQKHSAFIYYCLGHYYEVDRHDWTLGWEQYKKMGSVVDSCNYRYYFKYGCKEFREGRYREAWMIFTDIYHMLEIRAQKGWIQPLEMEYYYKCAKILSEIPVNLSVFETEIEKVPEHEVYNILENGMEKNQFIAGFIGERYRKQIQGYYECKMTGHSINRILGY